MAESGSSYEVMKTLDEKLLDWSTLHVGVNQPICGRESPFTQEGVSGLLFIPGRADRDPAKLLPKNSL